MLKIVQDSTKFSGAHWTCFTRRELILEEPVFPWVLKLCLRYSGVSYLIIITLQLNGPSQWKGQTCSDNDEWSFEQPGTDLCIPPARLIPTLPLAPCEGGHCWSPATVSLSHVHCGRKGRGRKICRPPENTVWLQRGRRSAVGTRCSKFRTIFTPLKSKKNREMFLPFVSQNSSY